MAAQMQRQWVKDTMLGVSEFAMGNNKRAADFLASAAMAFEASRACMNVWHLMRFHDLHRIPQLTTGADSNGKQE